MAAQVFANFAGSTVSTELAIDGLSLVVASGSSFPAIGVGDWCYLTITNADESAYEIVKATALSTNTFTIVRAQDNTSAAVWAVGSKVQLRANAKAIEDERDQPASKISDSTTLGRNLLAKANPSAVSFIRINENNSVDTLSAADMRAALGAGTSSLALGETSGDAYRGDYGKTAYDHSQATSGTPHGSAYAVPNASTTGSSGSVKSPATTGVVTFTGPGTGTTRAKTVRDADDTIVEVGGSYTLEGAIKIYDLNNAVSVFKYMTPSQRADVTARTMLVDVTTPLQAAITANATGKLFLELGAYRISSSLTLPESIEIIGASEDYLSESPYTPACAIYNLSTTTPAFTISSGTHHQGVKLRNFMIFGAGSGTGTPNGSTDDGISVNNEARNLLENLTIHGCGRNGVMFHGISDKTIIRRCTITGFSENGIHACDETATGGQINALTIADCEISGFGTGIRAYIRTNLQIVDNTIQGNTGYGIQLETNDASASQVSTGTHIHGNYFEGNVGGAIYARTRRVNGSILAYLYDLNIYSNTFVAATNITDINLICTDSSGSVAYHTFRGCRIYGNSHGGVTHCWINLNASHGHTTWVLLPQYVTLTFATYFQGFNGAAGNNPMVSQTDYRTSTGQDQSSANYVHQISLDTVNNVYSRAVTAGSGAADWVQIGEYYGSAAPTSGVYKRGTHVWNSAAASGAAPYWVQTTNATSSGASGGTRANTTEVSLGAWRAWDSGTTVWECTTAGTTDGSAPSIAGKVVGDTVAEGGTSTVVWTMRSLTAATWTAAANLT
jgi:hypothetical protein